jgi:hypothetical protein
VYHSHDAASILKWQVFVRYTGCGRSFTSSHALRMLECRIRICAIATHRWDLWGATEIIPTFAFPLMICTNHIPMRQCYPGTPLWCGQCYPGTPLWCGQCYPGSPLWCGQCRVVDIPLWLRLCVCHSSIVLCTDTERMRVRLMCGVLPPSPPPPICLHGMMLNPVKSSFYLKYSSSVITASACQK